MCAAVTPAPTAQSISSGSVQSSGKMFRCVVGLTLLPLTQVPAAPLVVEHHCAVVMR
jgi:hypothetical protein